MPRRTYTDFGWEARRVRLVLPTAEWAELEARATKRHMDFATFLTFGLSQYLDYQRARESERPVVYADAQGREHEEGDVR